jgi:hypothetical protein
VKKKNKKPTATTIRDTPKIEKSNSYNEPAGKTLNIAIDAMPEIPNRRANKP